MAERRKYNIPGDLELLAHLGHIKERDWTPKQLLKELKKLKEAVDTWGNLPVWWKLKNPDKWNQMKGTALMVRDCGAALRARRTKKAIKIYKLIQARLEREDKRPLQKMRALAEVEKLLEGDRRYSSAEIARKVGCSPSNVRRIKQNWKQSRSGMDKKKKTATVEERREHERVTLSWDEERYPDGPPAIPIIVKSKSVKETLDYTGVIATAKNRLRGQIKKGDSKHAKELQEKAAEKTRDEIEFGDTRILANGDDGTWDEYWKEVYDRLPPDQRFKKTADKRTADAFDRNPSTIKRRRLKHPELSK